MKKSQLQQKLRNDSPKNKFQGLLVSKSLPAPVSPSRRKKLKLWFNQKLNSKNQKRNAIKRSKL